MSLPWFSPSLKQLVKLNLRFLNFHVWVLDEHEKVSRDVQLWAFKHSILDGSSDNDSRLLQCSNVRLLSRESRLRLAGKVMKLFLSRYKFFNEDKELRSLGSAPSNRLQSLKFKLLKEYKPEKKGSWNDGAGDKRKEKIRFLDLDPPPLHPAKDNAWRFVKRLIEEVTSCMPVPLTLSSAKHCRLPRSSGNFLSSEQPERVRVSRDVSSQMLCGRLASFLQFLRFKKTSLFRLPIDEVSSLIAVPSKERSDKSSRIPWTTSGNFWRFVQPSKFRKISSLRAPMDGWSLIKLVQPFRIILLSFGAAEKSGVLVRCWEWLSLMNFNFLNACQRERERKEQIHFHELYNYFKGKNEYKL